MKTTNKSTMLLAMGLVIAAVLSGAGWVGFKILTRPGPRQLAEAQEAAAKAALTGEEKELMDMTERAQKLALDLENLPSFTPPADGIIPQDRFVKFADNLFSQMSAMSEVEKSRKPTDNDIGRGLMLLQRMGMAVQITHFTKLAEHQMSEDEYKWIENMVHFGEIGALARLDKLTANPDDKKKIAKYLSDLAIMHELYSADEKGEFIGHWEKVDQSTIPEQHVRYVVTYHKKLGFNPVHIEELDWTPLLTEMGITPVE